MDACFANSTSIPDPITWGSMLGNVFGTLWKELWGVVSQNPLLSGGAVLSMVSLVCYYARYVAVLVGRSIVDYLVNYVEINSSNV